MENSLNSQCLKCKMEWYVGLQNKNIEVKKNTVNWETNAKWSLGIYEQGNGGYNNKEDRR